MLASANLAARDLPRARRRRRERVVRAARRARGVSPSHRSGADAAGDLRSIPPPLRPRGASTAAHAALGSRPTRDAGVRGAAWAVSGVVEFRSRCRRTDRVPAISPASGATVAGRSRSPGAGPEVHCASAWASASPHARKLEGFRALFDAPQPGQAQHRPQPERPARGVDVARRLILWADVVLENFAPRRCGRIRPRLTTRSRATSRPRHGSRPA